ncbi:hypothetical protein FA95DRAFT_1561927 [Auriscalpium vulgare]|uniref:Uncharacterized protein n=1 Tax=Auriscalpium vulgare TaxID=40419 RepID=A0ACB8RKP3_9AGAM|nr:hypothetical protein FA95DRAFT_1561927 [Auriscalpium vulgare]
MSCGQAIFRLGFPPRCAPIILWSSKQERSRPPSLFLFLPSELPRRNKDNAWSEFPPFASLFCAFSQLLYVRQILATLAGFSTPAP